MFFLKSAVAVAACFAGLSAAFVRSAPDISPDDVAYTNAVGLPQVKDMIAYNGTGIQSYWFISFLMLENGHEYFLLHGTSYGGPGHVATSLSLMDITAKTYSGRTYSRPGMLSNTTFDSDTPDWLHIYAETDNQSGPWKAVSVIPEYPFNLTHTPRGANSYQAGAGTYIWGTDRCFAWDSPEALTQGTLTIDGEEVAVIPEQSSTWMDWQYGPGYASQGWYSFLAVLPNGVKITTMTTFDNDMYATGSVATFGYPSGHHEVYAVDRDFHPRNPWVSPATNITYYREYTVNIPEANTSLNFTVNMEGGELYNTDAPSEGIIIADTFSWIEGIFQGQYIKGWGNSERMSGNSPHM